MTKHRRFTSLVMHVALGGSLSAHAEDAGTVTEPPVVPVQAAPQSPARAADRPAWPPGPHLSVRAVVRMALAAAHLLTAERAEELGRKARLAGLVPQLKLLARRGLQQDLSSTTTVDDDRTNASQGDDLNLEASLTFQLDRLVFAPEQVRLLAIGRALELDRRKLIEDVVRLYFRRVRLLNELEALPADPELEAAIGEVEALLDVYTDGGFSEALGNGPSAARAR